MFDLGSCAGRWRSILFALGIDNKFLGKKNCPCPLCGGKDRYQFGDKDNGLYFCRKCGGGNGYQLLKKFHGWNSKTCLQKIEEIMNNGIPQNTTKKIDYDAGGAISAVLANARPLSKGDQGGAYLASRGLSYFSDDLLFVSKCYDSESKKMYPAILAKIITTSGKLASVQRIFLQDGKKAPLESPKKIMPCAFLLKGCAVRFGGLHKRINIAEGIETALAVIELTRNPCWSVLSAGGLESFVPPAGVEEVHIYGDNDSNYVGQASAYVCARRVHDMGIKAFVMIPEVMGHDWLDHLVQTKGDKCII